jgi:hypothetical protein
MLLYRLDGEVLNHPHMADAYDESAKLAERDSSLSEPCRITVLKEQQTMCRVRTERNLKRRIWVQPIIFRAY